MTVVREVMSTDLIKVQPSTMTIEAVAAMSKAGVGSVLVIEDDALLGIFTERDVLRAFDRMLDGGFRHLPVIDGDTLVGIVSMRDLARSISKA